MFFELRQYRMLPGMQEEWVKLMDEVIIPGQVAKGAVIVGSFVGMEEKDLYVWIRRFESEEQKATFYKDYYETDEWVNVLRPRVRELIDPSRTIVTLIQATSTSGIQ